MKQKHRPTEGGVVIDASTLYARHAGFVAGFLRRLGCPDAELADMVQDVFLIAHRKGGYVEGPAKPTTWLAAIAIRELSTARRKRKRRRTEPASDLLERRVSEQPLPEQHAADRERLERVQQALETLNPQQRAVFMLFELEGESCDAIAEVLRVPVGTVYSRLHAARAKFRQAYDRSEVIRSVRVARHQEQPS